MRPLAALLFVGAACRPGAEAPAEPGPVEVRCVSPARQSVEIRETLRGRVAAPPGGDLPVASQVAGRIVRVFVHEGDHVVPGALVAEIDGSNSRDALSAADGALAQARSAEANAEAALGRVRQLVTLGIAAKQELDDAVARVAQAHGGVVAGLAAADLARRTLGRVEVRSTFQGVATRVWRGPGALVDGTAATPIVELAATDVLEFDADATEKQLAGVDVGQRATVTLAREGEPISGAVRERSAALDPATGLGFVRVGMDAGRAVTLGAFGSATITLGERDDVRVVPSAAIKGAVADGAEVVVCKDGKADVRAAKVGWRDDDRVEITGGVEPGERVAVDHVLGLETGTPIVEAR